MWWRFMLIPTGCGWVQEIPFTHAGFLPQPPDGGGRGHGEESPGILTGCVAWEMLQATTLPRTHVEESQGRSS